MTLKDNVCALTDQFTLVTPDEMFDIRYGTNSILEKPEDALVGTPYTITGKLQYKESETDTEIKTYEAATFDWFKGSMEEFTRPNTVLVDGKPYSIHEALLEAHNSGNGNETAFQAALQGQWGERFTFAQKEITHTLTKIAEPIVFIAHNVPTEDGVIYCSDPKEIWLGGRAPEIEPGDPDVPNPDPEPDPDDPDPDPKDPDPDPEDPDTPARNRMTTPTRPANTSVRSA